MGIDVVATAKDFEKHAQSGYLPENLAKELHNLSDADRLAVAKQISWDMKQHPDASLPKIDFFDTGDLKAVEVNSTSGESKFVDHYELDKNTGKIKAEVKTTQTDNSYEHYTNIEFIERDSRGNAIHKVDSSYTLHGTHFTARSTEEKTTYDQTGKKLSHDESSSEGRTLHEEYDPKTGKERFSDEVTAKRNVHRTYDSNTGKLQQVEIVNSDKSQQTDKYNSNGDQVYGEKRLGNNGDKGKQTWNYSPRTGKPVHTDKYDENGKQTVNRDIDENGKWTDIKN